MRLNALTYVLAAMMTVAATIVYETSFAANARESSFRMSFRDFFAHSFEAFCTSGKNCVANGDNGRRDVRPLALCDLDRTKPSLQGAWMALQAKRQSNRTSRISKRLVPAGTSISTVSPIFRPSSP